MLFFFSLKNVFFRTISCGEEHDPEADGGERDLSVEKVICGEASRHYVTTLHTSVLSRQFGETTEIKLVTAHSFVPAKVIRFQPEREREMERELSETSLNVDNNVFSFFQLSCLFHHVSTSPTV